MTIKILTADGGSGVFRFLDAGLWQPDLDAGRQGGGLPWTRPSSTYMRIDIDDPTRAVPRRAALGGVAIRMATASLGSLRQTGNWRIDTRHHE